MNRRTTLRGFYPIALAAFGLLLCGCSGGYDSAPTTSQAAVEPPVAPVVQPAPQAEPEMVAEPAVAGVGKQGRYEGEGLIVTPIKTYFLAKQDIAFSIQIPHALQLYKAESGKGPQTHEEFLEKIIKPNQIHLPELPEGHSYKYDVEQELLMVEHPK